MLYVPCFSVCLADCKENNNCTVKQLECIYVTIRSGIYSSSLSQNISFSEPALKRIHVMCCTSSRCFFQTFIFRAFIVRYLANPMQSHLGDLMLNHRRSSIVISSSHSFLTFSEVYVVSFAFYAIYVELLERSISYSQSFLTTV